MTVRVNYDEGGDLYELGDDIDAVFVPFVTIDGNTVRGRVAAVQNAGEQPASGGTQAEPPAEPAESGDADQRIADLEQQLADAKAQAAATATTPPAE